MHFGYVHNLCTTSFILLKALYPIKTPPNHRTIRRFCNTIKNKLRRKTEFI